MFSVVTLFTLNVVEIWCAVCFFLGALFGVAGVSFWYFIKYDYPRWHSPREDEVLDIGL